MERAPESIIETKTIYITRPLQKINFQFRHPENAKSILGIMVNSNLFFDKRFDRAGGHTGTMALSNSQKGDVFYSQAVLLDKNDYSEVLDLSFYPSIVKSNLSQAGKKFTWFKTNIPISHAIMDCYYEDSITTQPLNDFGKIAAILPYEVILYIQYQLKNTDYDR